jgi:hypothetical protein
MAAAQIGVFIWQLALALLPAWAWLVICRLMRSLRKRVGFSYFIAAVLVLLSSLLTHNGLTLPGMLAGFVAAIVLYVQWKKALKNRSLEANTIIGYHNDDIF